MALTIPGKDIAAYNSIIFALDRSGQYIKFPTYEAYMIKRDQIADTLYFIYETTFLHLFRTDVNYDYLTYVARRFYLLLKYIFETYFDNLPLWQLRIWAD